MPDSSPQPFLADEPPPWVARGLATSAMVVAAVAAIAAVVIKVPETVTGRFVLLPERGADPVRAPREGTVTRVFVAEATPVRMLDTLFTVSSDPALDRGADRQTLEATVAGAPAARADLATQVASVRSADQAERRRLDGRITTLDRSVTAKRQQLEIARDLEARAQRGMASGVATAAELANLRLSASRTEDELSLAEGDLEDARSARARLEFEAAAREADLRDRARRLDLEMKQASARLGALRAGVTAPSGVLVVRSSCDGMLIRLHVRATGAVVQQGDVLADLACTSDSLVAEVQVPASGISRLQKGQTVRLLYDAFPYQRYGVRFGELTWVGASSPAVTAAATDAAPAGFLARVRPDDAQIRVDGVARPLVPGMGGSARIVVARRRLVSYAFQPLAQLREAAADRPVRLRVR